MKIALFCVLGAIFMLLNISSSYALTLGRSDNAMTQEEYEAAKRGQDKFHALLGSGDIALKQGDDQQAEHYYLEAYKFSRGSSSEAVARGKLARFYEGTGNYEKSLNHVNWFLEGLRKDEPSWQRYMEIKARLIKKLKEQKEWESKQDPAVVEVKETFSKVSPEEQKKFLESLGGKGVWDVFKDAMVAEHGGDFSKARGIYESLLPQKEKIEKEMGIAGWVMLYPAIQRTSELLVDGKKEKEALMWIQPNLVATSGFYHQYLSKLTPAVQKHLKERLVYYGIQE